eukprot:TRINITY_DN113326_c0_g1_i1.p1 TRINITY_DN113326_c0_g1~~TRINITY_DN113326_c0_g1_i1.p1  ORF type:complete len:286 (+),score=58.19 TRINITY_DN113326_c0_g1_i1:150-1007(+)
MVFREETFASRWLPFVGGRSIDAKTSAYGGEEYERRDALTLADSMEKGLAHEFAEDFLQPLQEDGRLRRFCVERSADKLRYRLVKEGGEFQMYAEVRNARKEVHFFLYDPSDKENVLYDPHRPAFVMACDAPKAEWLLSTAPKGTWYSSRDELKATASGRSRELEVALMRHSRTEVGSGVNHCMDVCIIVPGTSQEPGVPGAGCIRRLVSRSAIWNEDMQTLVLDFKGREVLPSAKNFQLCLEDRPGRVVCQHGKIAKNMFSLDFKAPLSVSQAFAMAVSTLSWD